MIDYGLLISTIISSAGVFSLIQFLINRNDSRKKDLECIKDELSRINHTLDETIIRVTRNELKDLIQDDPDNIDAILQVAEYYFIELDGNAYAHAMFENWAVEHGVSIGWLPKLKKGVKNGKKTSKI